jgi:hypothetical protein
MFSLIFYLAFSIKLADPFLSALEMAGEYTSYARQGLDHGHQQDAAVPLAGWSSSGPIWQAWALKSLSHPQRPLC